MDWFGDVARNVGNFFGGLFGGNQESEEEKRRKREEAQRRQQEARQRQATQQPQFGGIPSVGSFQQTQPQPTVQPTKPAPQQIDPAQIEAAAQKIADGGAGAPFAPEVLEAAKPRAEELKKQKRQTQLKEQYKKELRNGNLNPITAGGNLLFDSLNRDGYTWQERREAMAKAERELREENRKATEQAQKARLEAQDKRQEATSVETRLGTLRRLVDQNVPRDEIAKRVGLSKQEVDDYLDSVGKSGYQTDFLKGVGGFLGDLFQTVIGNATDTVATTLAEGLDDNVQDMLQKELLQADADYKAGRITLQRLQEIFDKSYGKVLNSPVKVTENGLEATSKLEQAGDFFGKTLDAGVNAASVLPLASGVTRGMQAGDKLTRGALAQGAKQAGKEGLVYGSADTVNDVVQGRGITPEALILNYGAPTVGNLVGELAGRSINNRLKQIISKMRGGQALTPEELEQVGKVIQDSGLETVEDLDRAITAKANKPAEQPAYLDEANKDIADEVAAGRLTANEQPSQVDELRQRIGSDSTPADQLDRQAIDNWKAAIQAKANIPPVVLDEFGNVADGAHRLAAYQELGIKEIPTVQRQKVVTDGQEKLAEQADNAREVISEVQDQASRQAQGGIKSGLSREELEARMAEYAERRRIYNESDPATRQEILEREANNINSDDVPATSPYERGAVMQDLRAVGLSDEDIARITQQYGMDANAWRTVLNRVGDLSKARDKVAVIVSDIKKMREGKTSTGTPETGARPAGQAQGRNTQTQSIYQSNIEQIRAEVTAILQQVDDSLKTTGSSFETLARKIQQADRNGTAPDLTDAERAAYSQVRETLDQALEAAGQAGRLSDDVGQREWYLPQAKAGRVEIPQTIDDIYNTGFGYQHARTNAIDLEELDYGFDPVIDYVVRGRAADQVTKQRIFENIVKENPNVTPEAAQKATEIRSKMVEDINSVTENPRADGSKIDTTGKLKEEAEVLGIQRVDDNTQLKGMNLNAQDRLMAINRYNDGFHQYRSAQAYAQNVSDPQDLPALFEEMNLTQLPQNRVDEIVARTEYLLNNAERYLPEMSERAAEQFTQSVYANAIRSAAKSNVEQILRVTNFTDPKVNALMNKQFNDMAIGFNKATSTMNQLGLVARRVMNNSMRNLNVNSFLNEMTDVVNALSRFGHEALPSYNPIDMYRTVQRYGLGSSLDAFDNPDQAVEAMNILRTGDKNAMNKLFSAADTIDQKTALYRFAENYKAAVYLRAAEDFYTARGLSGTQLTDKVLDDFYRDMLPLDHFSRVFQTDNQAIKLLTQYLDWNILNTRQQGRNLIGQKAGGLYADKGRGGRIGRNLAVNLAPRIGLGMVRGVPIVTTLGVLDPLGVASPDFSGLQDKNPVDEIIQIAGVSPILSLASQFYMNFRQDQEANEQYDGKPPEDNRGDWLTRSFGNVGTMVTPFGGQFKRTGGMLDVLGKGYSENKSGRVQYLAPENPVDALVGLVSGKGATQAGREYSGNPDLLSFIGRNTDDSQENDLSLVDWFATNPSIEALRTLMGEENVGDYNRPVSDGKKSNYSDAIKNTLDRDVREALLAGGREYNSFMDNLRKNNPEAYKNYTETFETGNFVSPEFWRQITGGNADGEVDLATWHMLRDRKKQAFKDLGIKYDPLYDLPDDRARAVLQQKATATGDDIALRNILYKEPWYQEYMEKSRAYYEGLPESTDANEFKQTERVKEWNAYNEQLSALSQMDTPELAMQFPYTAAYKAAQREYEEKHDDSFFGSEEAQAWFDKYGAGYMNERDAVDQAELEVINAMRVIEGFPPLSLEAYQQATEVTNEKYSGGGGGGRGGRGGGRSFEFVPEFFNSFKATNAPTVKIRVREFNPRISVGRRTNQQKNLGAKSSGGNPYTV